MDVSISVGYFDVGPHSASTPVKKLPSFSALLGALGVVYGDIGTSPLYAFKEAVKAGTVGGEMVSDTVLGIVSLILWGLSLIISVKYAVLILRADNQGEGGIVAMLALLRARHARPGSWRYAVLLMGLVGAALLYGDGAITPAISVLSAVEGLKVDAPALAPLVLPITFGILMALFFVQRFGTELIGRIFGPIMLIWFVTIGTLGLLSILQTPGILAAMHPLYAARFIIDAPGWVTLAVLGATFLAVTGGEAMYADMGHFGRVPIRVAWFVVVFPALLLNYCGQGALLLRDASSIENPFYRLAPDWLHYPLVGFATVAAVIASQAIISGAFSLTQQSIQLGFLPRVTVAHTASSERGQIYVPIVNWMLAAATLGAVAGFRSSDNLAGAYGVAVSLLMAITTILAALVAIRWGFNTAAVLLVNGFFLLIDLLFFAANSLKVLEGGWFPLLLAAFIAFLMLTWRRGQRLLEAARSKVRESESEFVLKLRSSPTARLPGTAAFLTSGTNGIPLALSHHLKHIAALHEHVLLVTVLTSAEPRVPEERRVEIHHVGCGISRVILQFGFMEAPCVPHGLLIAEGQPGLQCQPVSRISYYIGRETVLPTSKVPGMWVWRESVYAFMQHNAERSAAYFGIPASQVVEMGVELEI